MKIDQDLRAAIRSAEKSQPSCDYQVRDDAIRQSIDAFLKNHPAKARQIARLIKTIKDADKAREGARETLCKKFGLAQKYSGDGLELAGCGKGRAAFEINGGKLPKQEPKRWKFDAVMVELAAAEPKDAARILKKYGINWK